MAKITYNNNNIQIDGTLKISQLNIPTSSNSTTLNAGTSGQVLATNGTSVYWSTPLYAGSSSAGGAANSANKLNTNAGSATQPVYFSNGIPVAINTSITTTAPSATSADTTIPTSKAVWSAINSGIAANDALVYKGTLGTNGTISSLPATHKQGWTYKIITAGNYAGQTCSVGDMVICIVDGSSANNSHWTVVQNNVDLVGTKDSIGLIKNGSSVTSATGYTPSPIIGGVPYYKDTTYANKAAAENGTEVSLVTTGEKYNWNSKAAGDHSHTNYVTLDTEQIITGKKTFNAPININGREINTLKINTANGGSIRIGKEAANSGTMLRFDQADGTCRLRFRASATGGAMVWEQPERSSRLFFDFRNSTGETYRVSSPETAGTLAVTSQIKTKTSQLTNDSGFVTTTQMNEAITTAVISAINGSY